MSLYMFPLPACAQSSFQAQGKLELVKMFLFQKDFTFAFHNHSMVWKHGTFFPAQSLSTNKSLSDNT